MKIISAGWRMEYIEQGDTQDCIFCAKKTSEIGKRDFIIKKGKHTFVMMNLYPYTTGHLMVAPYRHVGRLCDLTEEEKLELMELVAWSEEVLRRALKPGGFNIGMNIGRCAGAGFPDHIHLHIVPRWEGDTNFMPVLSETKVLPETLESTYEKILSASQSIE